LCCTSGDIEESAAVFVRRLSVERVTADGRALPCPIAWIDNFAMRNFTNDAVFDDTLPLADGLLEAGFRVPLDRLTPAMEEWFRRKGYLAMGEHLRVGEIDRKAGIDPQRSGDLAASE
jgi:hypothetical protein